MMVITLGVVCLFVFFLFVFFFADDLAVKSVKHHNIVVCVEKWVSICIKKYSLHTVLKFDRTEKKTKSSKDP